jgi:hypothetical protein
LDAASAESAAATVHVLGAVVEVSMMSGIEWLQTK